jgi:acetyl-CoA acetyltransferase
MGETAENVAARYGVTRVEQDEFAVESQRRAATATAQAAFADEIAPVEVAGAVLTHDEHPRPSTTLDTCITARKPEPLERAVEQLGGPDAAVAVAGAADDRDHQEETSK